MNFSIKDRFFGTHLVERAKLRNFPEMLKIRIDYFQGRSIRGFGFLGSYALDGPKNLCKSIDSIHELHTGFAVCGLAYFATELHNFVE
jgi:hypothetical protein